MQLRVSSLERDYVFETLDKYGIGYVKQEFYLWYCIMCGKIYRENPESCNYEGCDNMDIERIQVGDIIGWYYNYIIERKKENDLLSSLSDNRLYFQLQYMSEFFSGNAALVFEGRFEDVISKERERMKVLRYKGAKRKVISGCNARLKQLMSIPATCYSDDTEILTKDRSWILFKDLTMDDEVACLSPDTHTMYWHKPTDIQKYYYSGEMIKFNSRSIDLLVTPDHMMYITPSYRSKYRFTEANKILNCYFINTVDWNGEEKEWFYLPKLENIHFNCKIIDKIKMDDWLEFLGWYIAEGCSDNNICNGTYRIQITQIKQNYLKEIENCLDRVGLNWRYDGHSFIISNKQLHTYLKTLGKSHEKYIPQEFMNLSKRQLKILFDALIKGDGTASGKYGIKYSSSSKKLINQIQEILIKLSYSCKIYEMKLNEHRFKGRIIKSKRKHYRIFVKKSQKCICTKNHISKNNYSGMVYCCTVPEHVILVRRNSKTAWCGNCMQYGVSFIQVKDLDQLIEMLKYFDYKCGTKPKIRTKRVAIVDSLPKFVRLLVGIPGIGIKYAPRIFEYYKNSEDLVPALKRGEVSKIVKGIGKKREELILGYFGV